MPLNNERCSLETTSSGATRRMALLAIAAMSLGLAVQNNAGNISPAALRWLTVSLVAAWTALAMSARDLGRCWLWAVPAVCFIVQAASVATDPFIMPLAGVAPHAFQLWIFAAVIGAGFGACVCFASPRARQVAFFGALAAYLALAWGVLHWLPYPGIDTLMIQEHSATAFLRGWNPYAIRFADPYPPELSAAFYAPGLSVNGILQFGYPYMPLTLLMSLPGHLLGDVRYASVVAMALSAILIAYARPSRASFVAGMLLLSTPAFPIMAYLSWTDSYVLLLITAVWFCHCRSPRFLPYAVGLLFVSKQYMVIAAPLVFLLIPRPWSMRSILPFARRAILIGAIVTLPLAIWDVRNFINSAVLLQIRQPFRWDALSYLTCLDQVAPQRWVWLGFAGAGATSVGAVLLAWRRPRHVSFHLGLALTFALFFAFNKQAFANYYYLVIGTLCCAAASADAEA